MKEELEEKTRQGLLHIYRKLQNQSKRVTPQRQLVIKIFYDRPGQHLSAEDVHQLVNNHYRDVGLATIYRSLDLLTALDVLQKIRFNDGRARFELNHRELHRHHHLVCSSCGKVDEFSEDLLEHLESRIKQEKHFVIQDHELKFYGVCRECQTI